MNEIRTQDHLEKTHTYEALTFYDSFLKYWAIQPIVLLKKFRYRS